MKQKIQALLQQLNHGLVEREDAIKAALLTVLAGENLVLIGPPGTGKSLLAQRIARSFPPRDPTQPDEPDYFEYLLTKFSTPEEIFGPLSITELKADRFRRNTEGYLPTVKIAFLDEIFKASSSILNALLTILNERVYHNGSERKHIPLQALIAASNELPTGQEELAALYDRFLVRVFVDYVKAENLSRLLEQTSEPKRVHRLSIDVLAQVKGAAASVTIPADIADALQHIWLRHKETFKEDRRENLSDRRFKKVLPLLRVSAATNGRGEVDLSDVFLLKNCLWNHQDNAIKVRDLISEELRKRSRSFATPNHTEAIDGQASPDKASRSQSPASPLGSRVRGLKGDGTVLDPLLVGSIDDLFRMTDPEVGQQGHHFRLTSDLDCTTLNRWMDIPFKGHFDGDGHTIKFKRIGPDWTDLFVNVQPESSIQRLRLDQLRLAAAASGSKIQACETNADLIGRSANDCSITACRVERFLIRNSARTCTISRCETGMAVIGKAAENCSITDCAAIWVDRAVEQETTGGITGFLTNDSRAQRCFAATFGLKSPSQCYFSGIAAKCNFSQITDCAVGTLNGALVRGFITGEIDSTSRLGNNAALEEPEADKSVPLHPFRGSLGRKMGFPLHDARDGTSVPSPLFNRSYFENSLKWDFNEIWSWDEKSGRPTLRNIGARGRLSLNINPAGSGARDLLTEQIRANMWL